jgi:hypothetical protein
MFSDIGSNPQVQQAITQPQGTTDKNQLMARMLMGGVSQPTGRGYMGGIASGLSGVLGQYIQNRAMLNRPQQAPAPISQAPMALPMQQAPATLG